MKEILDIIAAYTIAKSEGKRMALATVVHVDGSSYRRAGARMLVTDDGKLTGAISGGCLEGDALRKALLAINQQQNKLVTYDTTDDDDAKFGVQLGCNGILHILFEPIDPDHTLNPVHLLQQLTAKRQEGVLVTLFTLNSADAVPGTCLLKTSAALWTAIDHRVQQCSDKTTPHESLDQQESILDPDLSAAVERALSEKRSSTGDYLFNGQPLKAFLAFISPPLALVIVGAGNDAIPLASIATILGWHITVIDGRATHVTAARFPMAHQLYVAKAAEILSHLQPDEHMVFVLMTHNYTYDLAVLEQLLMNGLSPYIGSLGPKKKLNKMLTDLGEKGLIPTAAQLLKVFGPVGLDLGAETAEEIALSIAAEIKKALCDASGHSLRTKQEPIHVIQHSAAAQKIGTL